MASLGVEGPIATVTAGWQEREDEDRELDQHLGGRTVNLRLYRRAEEVFRHDPDLARAHHARQERLRRLQELYDLRLGHAMAAAYALLRRNHGDGFLERERTEAIDAIRILDAEHMDKVGEEHALFDREVRPLERAPLVRERAELNAILSRSAALAIAGGHVAVLLNRLALFGIADLAGGKPVIAWSAGAMAISDRVVLFHDNPPYGAGNAEVLESGLGLAPAIVPLPHARRRLRLDDPVRMGLFARRFAPSACEVMEDGARLDWDGRAWRAVAGVSRLEQNGTVRSREPV
jgi:hypothetical protein